MAITYPLVTDGIITGRTKELVFVRIPEVKPYRVCTLPTAQLPDGAKGDTIRVEVRSPIIARHPGSGWTCYVVPATEEAQDGQ